MKRLLALLLLLALPAALPARDPGKVPLRDLDDGYWERKNLISAGTSLLSMNGYPSSVGIFPVTIGYDRRIVAGFTLGVTAHYANHLITFVTDSYEVYEHMAFFGAKAGYDIPIVRNRLYLRVGLGAGMTYHHIINRSWGMMDYPPGEDPRPAGPLKDMTRFAVSADLHWVFRVTRSMELMLAPLIFSPSQIIISPGEWEKTIEGPYWNLNWVTFRLGFRF